MSDGATGPESDEGMGYASPSRPIAVALSSGSLYTYGLARFFELAHTAGAQAVEVIVDDRWDTRQADYLLRLRDEHRLPIVALHAPFWPVKTMASDYLDCIAATIRLAERIGAQVVVIHPEWSKKRTLAPRVYRTVSQLQASSPVILAVENMFFKRLRRQPRYPTYTVESMARFAAVTLDTSHFGTAGIDLLEAYRALSSRVVHVHLSDFGNGEEHLLPGDGILPLAAFLQALVQDDYQGTVTLELQPSAVGAGDDAAVVRRIRRALAFCQEHLRVPELIAPLRR